MVGARRLDRCEPDPMQSRAPPINTATYNPVMNRRRSIRLPDYDYTTPGAYFVTICVHDRATLLGEIVGETVQMSGFGRIARYEWIKLPQRFTCVALDVFVVMPNHLHGVIWILDRDGGEGGGTAFASCDAPAGRPRRRAPTDGLTAEVVERFGIRCRDQSPRCSRVQVGDDTTHQCATPRAGRDFLAAQRSEHVIRSEPELGRIRQYIQDNPGRWSEDQLFP